MHLRRTGLSHPERVAHLLYLNEFNQLLYLTVHFDELAGNVALNILPVANDLYGNKMAQIDSVQDKSLFADEFDFYLRACFVSLRSQYPKNSEAKFRNFVFESRNFRRDIGSAQKNKARLALGIMSDDKIENITLNNSKK